MRGHVALGRFENAMGGVEALSGMARALARRGVTSFLPTSVTATYADLTEYAETVRRWMPSAPTDGAEPLGFNMEGPFLAEARTRYGALFSFDSEWMRALGRVQKSSGEGLAESSAFLEASGQKEPRALHEFRARSGIGIRIGDNHHTHFSGMVGVRLSGR